MNDVKYIVDSLRRVQDGPGDSGTGQDATGRMSYVPSGHDAGVHMKGGVNNPYAGGYANGGAEGNMLLPEAKAYADSEFGEKVLAIGRRQLGLKYELGGDGIKTTDCGKFTLDTYNQVGVDLEDRTAPGQYDFCKRNGFVFNDLSQLRPGDLIFFKDTYDSGDGPGSITHVGIYAGNGIMLHAGSSKGVSYADLNSDYWQSHLYGYGRPRR
jgi:cell wall-associated NlpC family hydrolase